MSVDVSILLVSHGHGDDVRTCLASLSAGLDGLTTETIVIDNLSEPDFLDQIGGPQDGLRLISNEERLGFGANVNKAARSASGRVLLILNPDTAYQSGQLSDAVSFLEADESRGVVASRLVYPDGTIQRNFRGFPSLAVTFLRALGANNWSRAPGFYQRAMLKSLDPQTPTQVDWVYGSFMLIRKAHFEELGGFDEAFFMYYEDVDLCHRLRCQGLSTWLYPDLTFQHEHKRDSAGILPTRLQMSHATSLFRYAWKSGALITPPTFDQARRGSQMPEDPTLLDPTATPPADVSSWGPFALFAAHVISIVLAGTLASALVSWLSGLAIGADAVPKSTLGYGLIFVFFQFVLGEYDSGRISDTKRRIVGVLETGVMSLFPYLVLILLFVRGQEPPFVAYSIAFMILALLFLVTATILTTRRLHSSGAKIAIVTDKSFLPDQPVVALPIGQQTVAFRFDLQGNSEEELLADVSAHIRKDEIDHIYFLSPQACDGQVMQFVRKLTMYDVPIWQALYDPAGETRHEVLRLRSPLRSRAREAMKRGLDILVCMVALILLLPFMPVIALLIYIEDPGPIFFGQPRDGRNGVPFLMLKFRSMYLRQSDVAGDQLTTKSDNRITRIGAFIRRTSIDELPQIFNVLRGDMSIVGPRPLPVGFHFKGYKFEDEIPYWSWRHRVAPGITGLSQLNGLRGTPDTLEEARMMMKNRADFDNLYIDNWSIWKDLQIILMTALSGAFASKAY